MSIKQTFARLLAIAALAFAGSANASILTYDFTVTGGWFDCCGNPFGMASSPSLAGQVTVDNSQSGYAAFTGFTLTTGSKTWTLADIASPAGNSANFDGLGALTQFSLTNFVSGAATMYVYSNNTVAVNDGNGQFNACNGCVSIGQVSAVPEPETFLLMGVGLMVLVASRKRKAA